ncbi:MULTISPECIES: hypothetical protein [Bacillus]|uniref:hypothetical protein n=1 Tax=Bacillus TaxID=1386 RepID=UPI000458719F|nr:MULTISPECIES: hypothetical protein [Bacillus]AIW37813.1 hypothetical protein KS07_10080 [Bacillus subtilis]AHZ16290.1 hypothetical protein V529_22640 [Bacillus velezensis SQR9]AWD15488.1 hypothetical protein B9C53_19280 [Bacillus velezensis]MDH2300310.1 hypothetical protein [Bacillus velezensis]MDL5022456.1 hypothetical protein [Bacillus velezensis]
MNFESKYLVRWGMPGWVYMIFVTAFYAINHPDQFFQKLNSEDFPLVGFVAFAAAFGIILGHLIHQVSLFFGFVLLQYTKKNKRWRRYFRKEFKIDKRIIEEGEIGAKIKDIYSYRLGQLHARRGLLASLILSFITIIVMVLYIDTSYINDKTLILSAINGLLIMIMLINYHYFDRNLDYFMTRINDFENKVKQ